MTESGNSGKCACNCQHVGGVGGLLPERRILRYVVIPKLDARGILSYAVTDTATGEIKNTRDCMLWAERDAERLNSAGCVDGKEGRKKV